MTMSTEWREAAACRGLPHAPWYADRRDRPAQELAQELCAVCPVRQACLDYSLAAGEKHGVWGGLTTAQRAERLLAGGHDEVSR